MRGFIAIDGIRDGAGYGAITAIAGGRGTRHTGTGITDTHFHYPAAFWHGHATLGAATANGLTTATTMMTPHIDRWRQIAPTAAGRRRGVLVICFVCQFQFQILGMTEDSLADETMR